MNRVPVAVYRCGTYDPKELRKSMEQVCDAALMPDPQGKTVLLKPNILSDARPEKAITTHPEVLRALIHLLKDRGAARILMGDSPGGMQGTGFVPRASGIAALCAEENVQWCDFAQDPVMRMIPGTHGRKFPLPKILGEADMLISVCKMKTHQFMYVTGSVKNLFGLIPGLYKSSCHMRHPTRESFSHMIAGLYSVAGPSFAVMDAIVSMEGAGPAGGTPRHTGLLMASCDCTALDVAESIVMDYDPFSIPLIKELRDRKLTKWDRLDDITYPLLDAESLKIQDYKRIRQNPGARTFGSLAGPFLTRALKLRHQRKQPKPLFDSQKCIACGKCVRICPGKALTLGKAGMIEADYRLCIRCYCCHEVCPADAITIETHLQGYRL